VLHGDSQSLDYCLVHMHNISPKIQEVMEFYRWLILKLILQKFSVETKLHSSVWTLETNTSRNQYFFYICTHVEEVIRNNLSSGCVV
jgi:hypothetical protein